MDEHRSTAVGRDLMLIVIDIGALLVQSFAQFNSKLEQTVGVLLLRDLFGDFPPRSWDTVAHVRRSYRQLFNTEAFTGRSPARGASW